MAKAQYIGVGGVARKVAKNYVGVNGVARNVKNGYVGIAGVARQFFSSGIPWKKYSCDVNTTTTTTYKETTVGVGETGSKTFHSQNGVTLYAGYDFDTAMGYTFRGQNYYEVDDIDTLKTKAGYYCGSMLGSTRAKALQITAINNAYVNNLGGVSLDYDYKVVGCATSSSKTSTSYEQGDTEYGTVTAPEGELPEDGNLINGSADGSYCVLNVNGTYYYYVKEE